MSWVNWLLYITHRCDCKCDWKCVILGPWQISSIDEGLIFTWLFHLNLFTYQFPHHSSHPYHMTSANWVVWRLTYASFKPCETIQWDCICTDMQLCSTPEKSEASVLFHMYELTNTCVALINEVDPEIGLLSARIFTGWSGFLHYPKSSCMVTGYMVHGAGYIKWIISV